MNKIITLVVAFLLFIPFASINGSNVASSDFFSSFIIRIPDQLDSVILQFFILMHSDLTKVIP